MNEKVFEKLNHILIRPATFLDAEGIFLVSENSFTGAERWSQNMILNDLADRSKHYFVAETECKDSGTPYATEQLHCGTQDAITINKKLIVGFVGFAHIVDEAHMMDIAVLPAYRGNGVAKRLLDCLEQDARSRKIVAVTLEVRASNNAAKTLYLGAKYRFCGVRPNYYPDKEDAEIYWKEW